MEAGRGNGKLPLYVIAGDAESERALTVVRERGFEDRVEVFTVSEEEYGDPHRGAPLLMTSKGMFIGADVINEALEFELF